VVPMSEDGPLPRAESAPQAVLERHSCPVLEERTGGQVRPGISPPQRNLHGAPEGESESDTQSQSHTDEHIPGNRLGVWLSHAADGRRSHRDRKLTPENKPGPEYTGRESEQADERQREQTEVEREKDFVKQLQSPSLHDERQQSPAGQNENNRGEQDLHQTGVIDGSEQRTRTQ
jgi:hypothetical protein